MAMPELLIITVLLSVISNADTASIELDIAFPRRVYKSRVSINLKSSFKTQFQDIFFLRHSFLFQI